MGRKRETATVTVAEQTYELVDIDSVQPHPKNTNEGDVGCIIESIEVNGFIGAAVVQRSTGYIVAGKHRWLAAKERGLIQFPVIWADLDDATALCFMLADNRTARLGVDNPQELAELLESIRSDQGDLKGTGFDEEALQEIMDDMGRKLVDEQPEAAGKDKSVKCPSCGHRFKP